MRTFVAYCASLDRTGLITARVKRSSNPLNIASPVLTEYLRQLSVPDDWDPGIAFAELSDVGMRRSNNQDSSACLPASSQDRFHTHGHLFVVADGMGAHAAGELASRIATERIAMHYFRSSHPKSSEALRAAVTEANAEIHRRGQNNPEFHNMGTTASSLAILPSGAVVAHVGDSRVYRLRQGVLEQLTFDHSLVWEMEASGHSDSSSWGGAIPRNVITRSLGPNATVEVDVEGPFPIQPGDRFLICSDGLTGLVEDEEIGALMDCLAEEQAVRVLVDLANLRGGPDNITVVIVSTGDGFESTAKETPRRVQDRPSHLFQWLFGATVLCFLIAAGLGGLALGGRSQTIGAMIVMLILGCIAAAFCWVQYREKAKPEFVRPSSAGGQAPYRTYDAKPTSQLYDRLGSTVQTLREVATERNWMMDWDKVEEYQRLGKEAIRAKDAKAAIRFQAKAIIETMKQLREQHNRAANETAIDY